MVVKDTPFIFFDREELKQMLVEEQVWEDFDSLGLPAETSRRLRELMFEQTAALCAQATLLPVNEPGKVSALAGKHNFVLHKFCWGTIKMGYAVLSLIIKAGNGAPPPDGKDALSLAGSARDIYGSVEQLKSDEWAIVEAIETLEFRTGYNILRAPGPTLEEIRRELGASGLEYDNLPGKLADMKARTILDTQDTDGKTYYRLNYVRDWVTGL